MMAKKREREQEEKPDPIPGMAAQAAIKIKGAMDSAGKIKEPEFTHRYESDRARAEARIKKAQAALEVAGGHGEKKERWEQLGLAYWELEEAYVALGRLQARYKLAQRKQELYFDEMDEKGRLPGERISDG